MVVVVGICLSQEVKKRSKEERKYPVETEVIMRAW